MYPSAFGQPQLPHNPQQAESPFRNLSLSNPPHVPNAQPVDPNLHQYLSLIAAATAMEIEQNAQQSPLRMFMYNQFSQNNYLNPVFEALVYGICDYVMAALVRGAARTVEAAIQDAVPKLVQAFAATNVRQYPALEQYIDPNIVQDVRRAIAFFDSVGAEISAMKRGVQPQVGWQSQPSGWGGQQGGWGGRPMMGGQQGGYSSQFGAGGAGSGRPTGTVSVFGGGGASLAPAAPGAVGRTMGAGKYGGSTTSAWNQPAAGAPQASLRQPFQPKETAMQQDNQQAAAPVTTEQPAAAMEIPATMNNMRLWRPSAKYPYLPAYNPATQELYFQDEGDGTLKPIVKQKDSQVDYDRHATTSSFGPIPKTVPLRDSGAVMQRIDEGLKQLNNELAKPKETRTPETPKPTSTYVKTDTIAETSEAAAIFVGALDRLTALEGKTPDIYRAYARVADPVVSFKDESELVKKYASSSTFIELREKMTTSASSASPALWTGCNDKMTKLINRLLKQNLSLPELTIDSFVLDIQDLINVLGNNYGEAVQSAFLRHQSDNIQATFQLMYEDIAGQLTEQYLEGSERAEGAETPKVTYLASDLSLTYLNCLAHELDIQLAPQVGTTVVEQLTPTMYGVLDSLFKDVANNGGDFDRHLIITNDNRILEATKGYLGEDVYVLTLIK